MKTKELIEAPQLIVVYAITLLYTITFSLAAVIAPSTGNVTGSTQVIHQLAKIEVIKLDQAQVVRNKSSG